MPNTSYATKAELKIRVNVRQGEEVNDAFLQDLLNQAAQFVDRETRQPLEGYEAYTATATPETRYYDDDGSDIVVIDDCLSVTQVLRGGTEVAAGYWRLDPPNGLPKVRLLFRPTATPARTTAALDWYQGPFPGIGVAQIAVTGIWGYSATCPPGVKGLVLTLAERMYERTGHTPQEGLGGVTPEMVLDRYVERELRHYDKRRPVLFGTGQ